jgi:hypothetical protein
MRKLLNRKIVEQDRKTGNVPSATKNSRITTTLCQTIGIPKEWEELGETTTQITSKLHIGGVTEKRGSTRMDD